jgi:hypothetical protein
MGGHVHLIYNIAVLREIRFGPYAQVAPYEFSHSTGPPWYFKASVERSTTRYSVLAETP